MSEAQNLERLVVAEGDSSNWTPVIGDEFTELVDHLSKKRSGREIDRLQTSCERILRKAINPTSSSDRKTGLVIGYIQGGKTMSLTAVSALAADNGYAIVIVITGTTVNLYEQSADRLHKDLRLDSRPDRKWVHIREPVTSDRERIGKIIAAWSDPHADEYEKRMLLITVKKQHKVLPRLISVLKGLPLQNVAALIVDDEADQAGLNTKARVRQASKTYARLVNLRELFPRHSYLQYTATPQGNLLISILDTQSPDFSEVILPGEDYTGGIAFFGNELRLIRTIPTNEIGSRAAPLTEIPETLKEALRIFYIGVAAGFIDKHAQSDKNRTMLIHPSWQTTPHEEFAHWVRQLTQHWLATLLLSGSDSDRQDLLSEFRESYDDVKTTALDALPEWGILQNKLITALRQTNIVEINSTARAATGLDWRSNYSWIVIGGNALDRGFTVEGLTVTYMPRGLGVRNADALQQRARFFGHKRQYLGYCRIYLPTNVIDAFINYVQHEEDVRQHLENFSKTGLPLQQWRRAFLMPQGLNPTRRNILLNEHDVGVFSDDWFVTKQPHLPDQAFAEKNRELLDKLFTDLRPERLPRGLFGAPATRHYGVLDTRLGELLEMLLLEWKIGSLLDSVDFYGAALQLNGYLRQFPDEKCDVVFMNVGEEIRRNVSSRSNAIDNVFQGSNRNPGDPEYYPGDQAIKQEGQVCVQIRRLNLTMEKDLIARDVPTLAVWIPRKMESGWLVQKP
jgi:hypothetical protein